MSGSASAPSIERDLPHPDATHAFGLALGRLLRPGDVVALRGDLGAGKTTLARAIAEGGGASPGDVSSPTFVVVQEYEIEGRRLERIVHVDAYRVGADELDTLGWDRFEQGGLASMASAMLIEWPDRLGEALDPLEPIATVRLATTGSESRRLSLEPPAGWAERPGIDWLASRAPTRCRTTGAWVAPDAPSWPFQNERAQMADLYGWMSGSYVISRAAKDSDLEETE
ncbi:MAG: tRNA (adenosine(37)-N6)-threonylcarbamoyltransferase complex ATPase subunit type 1 TsaE [Planctomycetota bacterium]